MSSPPVEQPSTSAPAPSGSSLALLFRQVRDAMWARMSDELARAGHDLSFSQYIVLKKLAEGAARATDLARAAELDPGAMSRLLDRLTERGLIARIADPDDRRALQVALTPEGAASWGDIDQCGRRVRERALSGLSSHEQQQLTRLLEQVRNNLSFPDP
ncbi:MAG TPA: MarR family transcriptional regulator [Luteimonas sp.]|nr:MarR family transcriptional regulator [Luteimonas sp.]